MRLIFVWIFFLLSFSGTVYSWGMGSNMQLGLGDEEDQVSPQAVAGKQMSTRQGVSVSSGGQHTVILAKNMQNGVAH